MKRAADLGLEVAQFNLGCLYEEGKGVEKNQQLALDYFSKASQNGYHEADEALARLTEFIRREQIVERNNNEFGDPKSAATKNHKNNTKNICNGC